VRHSEAYLLNLLLTRYYSDLVEHRVDEDHRVCYRGDRSGLSSSVPLSTANPIILSLTRKDEGACAPKCFLRRFSPTCVSLVLKPSRMTDDISLDRGHISFAPSPTHHHHHTRHTHALAHTILTTYLGINIGLLYNRRSRNCRRRALASPISSAHIFPPRARVSLSVLAASQLALTRIIPLPLAAPHHQLHARRRQRARPTSPSQNASST
jgi:hypothetical protein